MKFSLVIHILMIKYDNVFVIILIDIHKHLYIITTVLFIQYKHLEVFFFSIFYVSVQYL